MTDTFVISFPRIELDNGFFVESYGGYWNVYHRNNPRQAVWTTVSQGEARLYSRLPDLQKTATQHHVRSAIDGNQLVLYLETSWSTPFGLQNGISVVKVKNRAELETALRC
jgi:hypothetical protein